LDIATRAGSSSSIGWVGSGSLLKIPLEFAIIVIRVLNTETNSSSVRVNTGFTIFVVVAFLACHRIVAHMTSAVAQAYRTLLHFYRKRSNEYPILAQVARRVL